MAEKAYCCERPPRDLHYVVKQKEIVGDDTTPLYGVDYCISPIGKKGCWSTSEGAESLSPILTRVEKKARFENPCAATL
jgi:hypothetical protein